MAIPTTAYMAHGCSVQWNSEVAMAIRAASAVCPSTVPGGGLT